MIVLDTHAWVWCVSNPEKLSRKATKAFKKALEKNNVYISSISAWEVALLVSKKRLELTLDVTDWIAQSEKVPFLNFIPVDNSIAIHSVELPPPLHSDPADRIIIATAMSIGATIITKDDKIREYSPAKTIW